MRRPARTATRPRAGVRRPGRPSGPGTANPRWSTRRTARPGAPGSPRCPAARAPTPTAPRRRQRRPPRRRPGRSAPAPATGGPSGRFGTRDGACTGARRSSRPSGGLERAGTDLVGELPSQVAHVRTAIPVLGDVAAVPQGPDRGAEQPDLGAEVVEVVLAGHSLAGRFQDATEEVAHERASRVADVEGAGGVGRDELDVDVLGVGGSDAAERRAGGPGGVHGRLDGGGGEAHVEEARRRDLDGSDDG